MAEELKWEVLVEERTIPNARKPGRLSFNFQLQLTKTAQRLFALNLNFQLQLKFSA